MPRVKRWVPWDQTVDFPAWPWYPLAFNLSILSEFAEGETLLRSHVDFSMEVYAEDGATSAYPAPWRRIPTVVALSWSPEGDTPLGFYSAPEDDYLYVAQVQWDMAYYTVNAPTTAQVRGTWSRNTDHSGVIDSKSQRIATGASSSLWLTVDCAPDGPGDPSQYRPYFNLVSRYLVDGV